MDLNDVKNKIKPFVTEFDKNLKERIRTIKRVNSPKGQSGAAIIEIKDCFIGLIEKLITKMKNIIFNDIKNKKLKFDNFEEIKSLINEIIKENDLVKNFKNLMRKDPLSSAFNEVYFDNEITNLFDRLYVDFEQEFDDLSS